MYSVPEYILERLIHNCVCLGHPCTSSKVKEKKDLYVFIHGSLTNNVFKSVKNKFYLSVNNEIMWFL